MTKKSVFTAIATISVCVIALSSCNEKPAGELYVHYTPEELDAKTLAVIEKMKSNSMYPSSEEAIMAMVNDLAKYSYEERAAVHPEFSNEYTLDSLIDENGFKTLKLTYNGNRENNLPQANVVYTHGGGFISPMSAIHRDICERLARQMNFTVYIPLYPLYPNYYVHTTMDMLIGLYKKIASDGKPVYLMGDSAGGNITLSFALYLKRIGEKLPDAIFAISPICDFSGSTPGLVEQNKTDIFAPMEFINVVYTIWRTKDMSATDPLVSPLFGDWTGMPKAFLFAGTEETFYPEIMDMAQKMKDAGMSVGVLVGTHLFHVAPCCQIPAMDQYFDEITEFLYGAEK